MVAQKAPKRFQHPASFSYLGVPAATGMSDCYESMSRPPIRDGLPPPVSSSLRSKACPVPRYGAAIQPQIVIPAKAGIQRGGGTS